LPANTARASRESYTLLKVKSHRGEVLLPQPTLDAVLEGRNRGIKEWELQERAGMGDDDDVFYLFLQKQNQPKAIYPKGTSHHARLFRGPMTNGIKKARNALMMLMSVICACRNNNQPNAIYPLGTFHRGLKKAHVMMLPSCPIWYFDNPFPPLVDVMVR